MHGWLKAPEALCCSFTITVCVPISDELKLVKNQHGNLPTTRHAFVSAHTLIQCATYCNVPCVDGNKGTHK